MNIQTSQATKSLGDFHISPKGATVVAIREFWSMSSFTSFSTGTAPLHAQLNTQMVNSQKIKPINTVFYSLKNPLCDVVRSRKDWA